MQSSKTAVKHTAGYHPLPQPHHGAGDVAGLILVLALMVGAPLFAGVVAWRLFRWFWRATR